MPDELARIGEAGQLSDLSQSEMAALLTGFLEMNRDEKIFVEEYFKKLRYGPLSTSTLNCKGANCSYWTRCLFNTMSKEPPVGRACQIEDYLINIWVTDICTELGITKNDAIDLSLVFKIAKSRMFRKRADEVLAEEGLQKKSYRGVDKQGNALYEWKLHPLINLIEKCEKLEDLWHKRLIATRQAKHQAHMSGLKSTAEVLTKLNERVNKKIEEHFNKLKEQNVEKSDPGT